MRPVDPHAGEHTLRARNSGKLELGNPGVDVGECIRYAIGSGFGLWLLLVVVGECHAGAVSRYSAGVAGVARRPCLAAGALAVTALKAAGQRRERGPRGGRGPRYC